MSKPHTSSFLDTVNLERQLEAGFISRRKHPEAELYIYNYTPLAQFTPGVMLNEAVKNCRGLITDADGYVLARPFPKFHNVSEHASTLEEATATQRPAPLPAGEPFEVFAKMDGSLGIAYPLNGEFRIATRGSFESPQAIWATEHFKKEYAGVNLPEGQTYLFEIISPVSRIVVNYDFEGLVLLAVLDNATGKDLPIPADWPGRVVERYDFSDLNAVTALEKTDPEGSKNSEGYVIRFASGVRTKVKFADYLRLHRTVTGTSTKTVYDYLGASRLKEAGYSAKSAAYSLGIPNESADALYALGDPLQSLLDVVPDEMHTWLREQISYFEGTVNSILVSHRELFEELKLSEMARKDAAICINQLPPEHNRSILLNFLQGKDALGHVWKSIRPKYARAYMVDPEG